MRVKMKHNGLRHELWRRTTTLVRLICLLSLVLVGCGRDLTAIDKSKKDASYSTSGSAVSAGAVSGGSAEAVSKAAVSGSGADIPPSVDEQIDILIDRINLWCDECEFDEPAENDEFSQMEGINDGKYCVTDMDDDGWLEIVQWIDSENLFCQELTYLSDGFTLEYIDMTGDDEITKKWVDTYQKDVFCEDGEEVANIRIRMRPDRDWLKKRMRMSYDERRSLD